MVTETTTAQSIHTLASQAVPESQSQLPTPAANGHAGHDVRLADILRREEAGEKLSASDRGYKGSQKRKAMRAVAPAPAVENQLLQAQAPAENQLFEAVPEVPQVATGEPSRDYDSVAIRAASERLLGGIDTVTQRIFAGRVKRLGANKETIERWKEAVAMGDTKAMMADGSEPIVIWLCEMFGCTPEELDSKLKTSTFVTGMVIWVLGIKAAAADLKELAEEKKKQGQNEP